VPQFGLKSKELRNEEQEDVVGVEADKVHLTERLVVRHQLIEVETAGIPRPGKRDQSLDNKKIVEMKIGHIPHGKNVIIIMRNGKRLTK